MLVVKSCPEAKCPAMKANSKIPQFRNRPPIRPSEKRSNFNFAARLVRGRMLCFFMENTKAAKRSLPKLQKREPAPAQSTAARKWREPVDGSLERGVFKVGGSAQNFGPRTVAAGNDFCFKGQNFKRAKVELV